MKIVCKCGNSDEANLDGYDIPKGSVVMRSNYCPNCEHKTNDDYWEEWFEDENGNELFIDGEEN